MDDELRRILDTLDPDDRERVLDAVRASSSGVEATVDAFGASSPGLHATPVPSEDDVDTVQFSGSAESSRAGDGTLTIPPELEDRTEEVERSGPERYEVLDTLGEGGMGQVLRVRDTELNRTVAMKILRRKLLSRPGSLARFREEAQIAAQLQHPGIIPVHDIGRRPDGSVYFTMKEVKGSTLEEVIEDVHIALEEGRTRTATGVGFRRLIDLFHRVCETVAYAHHRGVVHRDLKPENIMVGGFGEVLVLDWGLAKVLGQEHAELDSSGDAQSLPPDARDSIRTERALDDSLKTRVGAIAGTPRWMAPEQARGQIDAIDSPSDVYALGGILYLILTGRTVYTTRDLQQLIDWVQKGEPFDDPREVQTKWLVPDELAEVALKALEHRPQDRYPTAAELAAEVGTWLDGARRRERALEVVQEARDLGPRIAELQHRATELRERAQVLLEGVRPGDPEERKLPAWEAEDLAQRAEAEAAQLALERVQGLRNALSHDPDNREAHAALADLFHAAHVRAEADGDGAEAKRVALELANHDRAGRYAHYLRGDGALTLLTDPPGATVTLYRFVERNRRLVPELEEELGTTPLVKVPLPMGSYLCVLRKDGHEEVKYPVLIERNLHWNGVPPGATEPLPIRLPKLGELEPDDCYVPAGWYWSGGRDPGVTTLPWKRVWGDALVVKRFHVTFGQYRDFLHALVDAGRTEEAERYQPHYAGGEPLFQRDGDRFVMTVDRDGDPVKPEFPACQIDHESCVAYAAWWAEQTGHAWRLPEELEFEKYARGVDGRPYATGHHLDPSWTIMKNSLDSPGWAPVDSHPLDVSVYGVRKTIGTIVERCHSIGGKWVGLRGGGWASNTRQCLAAAKKSMPVQQADDATGTRVVRKFSDAIGDAVMFP
ncbi:MAG: bifunctional serine/threonine-protein kinase/formylglycine-generating enzyme family protein [Myxococcota bacterium]